MTPEQRADWLLDAIAMSTQNRMFLRDDDKYDPVAGEAVLLNGEKAIRQAIAQERERVLALLENPTDQMLLAANAATASWKEISGSQLTVNKEKMRIRLRAISAAIRQLKAE